MTFYKRKKKVGIGLIGSGFMGKAHANAFRSVSGIFNLPLIPNLEVIADINLKSLKNSQASSGFMRLTDKWKDLIKDKNVDIVAITTPNILHKEMALYAIALGKTVYCEKPLSIDSKSASKMAIKAKSNKIITMVGFTFLRNPMIHLAKNIIDSGEIGEIRAFNGIHAEDYMGDEVSHSFRTTANSGGGALMDLGSHIISIGKFLLGSITEVVGIEENNVPMRLDVIKKKLIKSKVDDRSIFMAKFSNGVMGNFEACWNYTGSNMKLAFEVTGSKGAIKFNQERMNELLFYSKKTRGFSKIESGPEHQPYGNFCPAPGHHLGFNDLKIIEVADLINAHHSRDPVFTDFEEGYQIQLIIDSIKKSSKYKRWIKV